MVDLKNADVRTTHDLKEILALFQAAQAEEAAINFWQLDADQKRTIFNGKFVEINEDKIKIELDIDQGTAIDLERKTNLFFRVDFQNMIFKRETVILEGNILSFKTPTEIRLVERRKHVRRPYLYNDHKEISFSAIENQPGEKSKLFFGNLLNISESGVSFIMSEDKFDEFFMGKNAPLDSISEIKLKVNHLTDQKLAPNFYAKGIFFIRPKAQNQSGERQVRVGLCFDDLIPQLNYISLNETNREKLEREKEENAETKNIILDLKISGYFGLSIYEQEKLYKDLESKEDKQLPELKDNLKLLEQLEYLTKAMKINLFREISISELAMALRLCRKFVIITLLKDVTDNMREEFLHQIQAKQPLGKVLKAQQIVVKYIKDKEKSGDIYLDPDAYKKEV